MRIVFMGTPEFSVPALDALAARHEIAAVYCQPPRPAGRGQRDRPSPVQARAEALGLPVRHPKSLRDAAAQADFAALGAEVAVVVAYGLILPPAILAAPARGCLNIHASLLPRWRGAAPIHRAVLAGDACTGVCIMRMEAGLDTGPVILRDAVAIGAGDTTGDLHDRLSDLGARLIVAALDRLDDLAAEPQDPAGVTYAAKIDKAEARIDWSLPAEEVDRRIRGLSPFPGAWAIAGGERLKLLRSRVVAADPAGAAAHREGGGAMSGAGGSVGEQSASPAGEADPLEADAVPGAGQAGARSDGARSDGGGAAAAEAAVAEANMTRAGVAETEPALTEAGVTEARLEKARGAEARLEKAGAVAADPGPGGAEPFATLPGTVLGGFRIACGTGAVEITLAQREGRRPMPAEEILRGLVLPDRLG